MPGHRPPTTSLRGMAALLLLSWLRLSSAYRADREDIRALLLDESHMSRIDKRVKSQATSEDTSSQTGEIDVVVDNQSGQDIRKLMIIHKHLGLSPGERTHVMEWENIRAGDTTPSRKFASIVGAMALRNDWWLATWSYEKSGGKCPACEKHDGTCATWLTTPSSRWLKTLLDPATYVKAAATAVNVAVTAASAGTATTVSVALGTMVTSAVANSMLAEDDIDGYKSCGIKEATLNNSRSGIPLTIVILPQHDASKALLQPARVIIRQFESDADNCEIGAAPMRCVPATRTGGDRVRVRLANPGAPTKNVHQVALLHRFRGLSPSLKIMYWDDVGNVYPFSTHKETMTKTWTLYDDMWMLAWREAGNSCVVKSTVPQKLWKKIKEGPELGLHMAAVKLGGALIGPELSILADFAAHSATHDVDNRMSNYGWEQEVEELMGREALFHLAGSEDTAGFVKCNLETADLANENGDHPITVEIPATEDGNVIFRWHDRTCEAPVVKLCRQTKKCLKRCKTF